MSRPPRVVVIGHGMVAARFLDDLTRHAERTGAAFDITVLGEEPYEPYNRLMLSEVVAGRADLASLTLPAAPEDVTVHAGTAAVRLERERRVVIDAEGREHPYDLAVFATGAEAVMPPIPGLGAGGGQGVRAVRTIDDCRELLAVCTPGRRMAVLGGGLLGVEIACGLRTRDVDVTLVHRGGHVMDRQLDAPSGQMAAAVLGDLGVDVRVTSGIVRVLREKEHLVGIELADGERLDIDGLVVNTGVKPRAEIARAAGVPVDIGILVDERLRALDDDSVAAIGDCAQTDAGCPGLIAPGWEQAGRLARELCENDQAATAPRSAPIPQPTPQATPEPRPEPEVSIVKLKAVGLDVVALGEPLPDPFAAHAQGLRVLTLSDVGDRRSATIAVDGERIVAGVVVGSPRVAADLMSAYERRTPLPLDPAHLLVKGASNPDAVPQAAGPTALPSTATVCRCNGVSKKEIVDAHVEGARCVEDVAAATRATTGCGSCTATVCGILAWMDEVNPAQEATMA
ncbi:MULTISPECIES: FAD-dependent oxidoreductase [Dermacoccus]|uniref:NAD(P)/FAD-dependent oxidoreductase n=2 Tax=Dermacoccus TaxID=57495 RepID=A0A417ZBX1_9MICO|nr:FAD-dependent oxidoreductase [Dermacoccus abyssi]RHW48150.1 NAD(P)/FAD-dependent oxidoreductase [Dermacoccus abyssi]